MIWILHINLSFSMFRAGLMLRLKKRILCIGYLIFATSIF